MIVKVIYPADQIGQKEEEFLHLTSKTSVQEALAEARLAFEDTSKGDCLTSSRSGPWQSVT